MNSIFRWQGLVGFGVFIATLAVLVALFLDTGLRLALVWALEDVQGAEVNVERVEHQWQPFGVSVYSLAMTDPANPDTNQLEAQRISATLNPWSLLMQKLEVDQLTIDGLALSTPRQSTGAVYRPVEQQDTVSTFALPEGAPKDIDSLLAALPLQTPQAADALKQAYQQQQTQVKAAYENLPDKSRIDDYKQKIDALKQADTKSPEAILAAKQQLDDIKKALKKDQQAINDFKQTVAQAREAISPKLAALKAAPGKDYAQAKALAGGDAGAITDLTRHLFGDKAAQTVSYLLAATDTLAPMLNSSEQQQEAASRAEGRWITFDDASKIPDVWIKDASVSVILLDQTLSTVWQDITYQHDLIGKPTRFSATASTSPRWQGIDLKGDFAFSETGLNGQQQWDIKGLLLPAAELLNSPRLTTALKDGLLNASGKLSISGNQLDGNGRFNLPRLSMRADTDNQKLRVIADALQQLTSLNVGLNLSGDYRTPDVAFSSDLGRQLASAMVSSLSPEVEQKLNQWQSGLLNDANAQSGATESGLGQWQQWLSNGDQMQQQVDKLLETQLDGALDKQKDKLKDKLKNLLGKDDP
ncbi:TIGR03545 family protein [Aestuariibacter halophilus]|uniref:TIGR03545 family protein n=1 Tax=Fluctibacter halophilus TaxID=226011 RepID=A0ABS8GBL3_9ALTE|nr:TIGR03545 family protein [Aestuariibacter halophilus]MCC2617977.1 TIGR03545 family protein [Aestuariibacter halophilus]